MISNRPLWVQLLACLLARMLAGSFPVNFVSCWEPILIFRSGSCIEDWSICDPTVLCLGAAAGSAGAQIHFHSRLQGHPAHPLPGGGVRDHAPHLRTGHEDQATHPQKGQETHPPWPLSIRGSKAECWMQDSRGCSIAILSQVGNKIQEAEAMYTSSRQKSPGTLDCGLL